MALEVKAFMFNRISDWQNYGKAYHLSYEDDELVTMPDSAELGYYFSKSLDCKESGTVWHRLRVMADRPRNTQIRIKVYASNSKVVSVENLAKQYPKGVNLDEYLTDETISCQTRSEIFGHLKANIYENLEDILLYSCKGRYFWLCIETANYNQEKTKIKQLQIEFPRASFSEYLPEIYRTDRKEDSFFERFIGIYQSLYMDMDDKIGDFPMLLDPDNMGKEFLYWFAEWFAIKDRTIWGESRLRLVIREAVNLYNMKGTKSAISRVVELYTGCRPMIVEKFEVQRNRYYSRNKKHVDILFGDNSYYLTIILKQNSIKTSDEYAGLLKILEHFTPINSICNLVVLDHKLCLDHHCYLGCNSEISGDDQIILDENSRIYGSNFLLSATPLE